MAVRKIRRLKSHEILALFIDRSDHEAVAVLADLL